MKYRRNWQGFSSLLWSLPKLSKNYDKSILGQFLRMESTTVDLRVCVKTLSSAPPFREAVTIAAIPKKASEEVVTEPEAENKVLKVKQILAGLILKVFSKCFSSVDENDACDSDESET
jgi:hypothetical protein